jgi:hypothetical protein
MECVMIGTELLEALIRRTRSDGSPTFTRLWQTCGATALSLEPTNGAGPGVFIGPMVAVFRTTNAPWR